MEIDSARALCRLLGTEVTLTGNFKSTSGMFFVNSVLSRVRQRFPAHT